MPDIITAQVKQRKAYVKPEVEVVDLMPKQTVLGGCLTASNSAAGYIGNGADSGCGSIIDSKCVDG
jgi:hypothetical protein